jgi:hypothetical protein
VGRGGLFAELCATGRVHELARLHRFTEAWEAAASLQMRAGNPSALDAYQAHGRIVAGPLDDHLHRLAVAWIAHTSAGRSVAVTGSTNDHVDAINAAIQAARSRIGHLDPTRGVAIGGGEVAHVGDVVVTRRNDRTLCTETGQPVRNRDVWDVVATGPDGSLTVSHRTGHGTVALPADYARDHVRLGYAATEHGHQGDTVDLALELVSTATTHRGLYVGVTRGRDENRLHVITETDDATEARDVLDAVLARDRADIPAVTQRRELARLDGPHRPQRTEPASSLPAWIGPWRTQIEHRRQDLLDDLAERTQRRVVAAAQLADLQPALTAARAAWQPHADAIAGIERQLHDELRPALWTAKHAALDAGFGHHRATRQRARDAAQRVAHAETRIATLHAGAADVKQRLDTLEAETRNLHDLANPSPSGYAVEDLLRSQVHDIGRLSHAVDVWTAWSHGRPVTVADLNDSAQILTDTAHRDPPFATTNDNVDRFQWIELVELLRNALRHADIDLASDAPNLQRTLPELGIEL